MVRGRDDVMKNSFVYLILRFIFPELKLERPAESKRGDHVIHGTLLQPDVPKAKPGNASDFFGGLHSRRLC